MFIKCPKMDPDVPVPWYHVLTLKSVKKITSPLWLGKKLSVNFITAVWLLEVVS